MLSQAECTQNYDPYYGFKVIQQGQIVYAVLSDTKYLVHIQDEAGCLLGTASRDEFALHFSINKGEV